jgi:hypothetical protein
MDGGNISAPTGRRRDDARRFTPSAVVAAAVVLGMLASGALVWQSTSAVFSSTTSNAANSWTAGAVTLADDDSSGALFTSAALVPSSTGSNCIKVTYSGNVSTAVKLYVAASTGSLAPYVDLVVSEGTGVGFGDCTGFSGTQIYSGTLSAFAAASSVYSNGVGSFAPTTAGQTKVYKFTYTIDAATPNAMQSQSATATFQWESQA